MIANQSLLQHGLLWTMSKRGQELLSPAILDLESHLRTGLATVIKTGEHRSVYRVRIDGLDLFFKHAKFYGPRGWWRDAFRGPKSGIEFRRLQQLIDRGIPTIQPLAWARFQGRWPRGSFLVTEAMPQAKTLGDWLTERVFRSHERRFVASILATLIAKIHDAGFIHTDLHPGNILVDGSLENPDWKLIDVHDLIAKGRPLTTQERMRNLVMLNRWFSMRTSEIDRFSFWKRYTQITGISIELAKEIEQQTVESNLRLWISRDSRTRTENRDFQRCSFPGFSGFQRRGLSESLTLAMQDPEKVFDDPQTRILKDSRTSKVALVTIGEHAYILKRFNVKKWYASIANLVRPSPALRSWIGAGWLENRGIRTPTNLMVIHRKRFGLLHEGYLLTEFLPEARTIDIVDQLPPTDQLVRLIRKLHSTGLTHRDLKAANILLSHNELYFIDLVGLERPKSVNFQRRVRDLTRLNISSLVMPSVRNADRVRFLAIYLKSQSVKPVDWRVWWKEIAQRSLRKIAKNKRNNRPLS